MVYFVYILCSRPGGALYIGSTKNLRARVEQHRQKAIPGHTARYNIDTLVWFQAFDDPSEAFQMERRMKKWRRAWKEQLIMDANPNWRDITSQIPD